tara:strand:- start:4343 stop:5512 length:1170 start_codon:yes stop_codon:yes gene_type:complete
VLTDLAFLNFYNFGRMDKTTQIQGAYIYLDALNVSIHGLLEAKSLTVQRTAAAYYYNMFHNNLQWFGNEYISNQSKLKYVPIFLNQKNCENTIVIRENPEMKKSYYSAFNKSIFILLLLALTASGILKAQKLPLPIRANDAITGNTFKDKIESLSLEDREKQIYQEILNGNVPTFLRVLIPISFSKTIQDSTYVVTYFVLPDYLAVGSDADYFLIPMTPILAQKIAKAIGFTLPTKRMVDQIWSNASLKLAPSPIPPTPQMTTIPVMWEHNTRLKGQRKEALKQASLGDLVAGHKKDVIISNKIYEKSSKPVVIYGWHYQNGTPIQPIYAGHSNTYADYSHGIRLVQDSVLINNKVHLITSVLRDVDKSSLFSDEGVIGRPFYPADKDQ